MRGNSWACVGMHEHHKNIVQLLLYTSFHARAIGSSSFALSLLCVATCLHLLACIDDGCYFKEQYCCPRTLGVGSGFGLLACIAFSPPDLEIKGSLSFSARNSKHI